MSMENGDKKEPEHLSNEDLMKLWAWAFNTSGYWMRSLDLQHNGGKRVAMVIIDEADAINICLIEKLSRDVERLRKAESTAAMQATDSEAEKPRKGLKQIFRRAKRG